MINARSVGNKAPNIIEFITENNLDILVITETWLFSEEIAKLKAITPGGYEPYSAPRDARKGGGVGIICRNVLKCKVKEFNCGFHSFECIQLDVNGNNKSYSLYPLYRSEPNNETMGKFLDEFSTLLEEISVVTQDIVILGYFNIHIDVNNSTSSKFNDIIRAFDLVQHVMEPTHESGHILDLVI